MKTEGQLTTTSLLTFAKETLAECGYVEVKKEALGNIDPSRHCIFEDSYCLVAIVLFETWSDLEHEWRTIQSSFVEFFSERFPKHVQKVWDCYLVFWTLDLVPTDRSEFVKDIQYDTDRVRKLVTTGDGFHELIDVKQALLPLLPIFEDSSSYSMEINLLARLPGVINSKDLPEALVQSVVQAFEEDSSLVESIHTFGGSK